MSLILSFLLLWVGAFGYDAGYVDDHGGKLVHMIPVDLGGSLLVPVRPSFCLSLGLRLSLGRLRLLLKDGRSGAGGPWCLRLGHRAVTLPVPVRAVGVFALSYMQSPPSLSPHWPCGVVGSLCLRFVVLCFPMGAFKCVGDLHAVLVCGVQHPRWAGAVPVLLVSIQVA